MDGVSVVMTGINSRFCPITTTWILSITRLAFDLCGQHPRVGVMQWATQKHNFLSDASWVKVTFRATLISIGIGLDYICLTTTRALQDTLTILFK